MDTYQITLRFESADYGSFQQRLVFDFAERPLIFRQLEVVVAPEKSLLHTIQYPVVCDEDSELSWLAKYNMIPFDSKNSRGKRLCLWCNSWQVCDGIHVYVNFSYLFNFTACNIVALQSRFWQFACLWSCPFAISFGLRVSLAIFSHILYIMADYVQNTRGMIPVASTFSLLSGTVSSKETLQLRQMCSLVSQFLLFCSSIERLSYDLEKWVR